MAVLLSIPVSTEVIESNPDCQLSGQFEDGVVRIVVDTREENVHQRLGLPRTTRLFWSKENSYEVQELSAMLWPIRYRVLVREGYYMDKDGKRVNFTTQAKGLDARRGVSEVLLRAAVMLVVIAGVGVRKAAWLLGQLFHVELSKSSLQRWIEQVADTLPSANEMVKRLDGKKPITEMHLDEYRPSGSGRWVLVFKDEHGRLVGMEEVSDRTEETVKPFLERFRALGLGLGSFYTDGCKAYYNAIRSVFGPSVPIQYDYFHIIQNAWRHLWKWATARRRELKQRSKQVKTPWYKAKLAALAKSLWEKRYLLFKAEEHMSEEERECLVELVEADQQVGRLRGFLAGVWHIFEDSKDQQQARAAVEHLKTLPMDRTRPEPFKKVLAFLEENFEWMTAFLRYERVRRNSLAESGMRILRRLEVDHDGLRSEKSRDNYLRIYQAVKYLHWSVYRPSNLQDSSPAG
jgi:transposase